MTPLIDLGIVFFLIILLVRGWRSGIVRTLIGPLSLIASIAASTIYFNKTHQVAGLLLGTVLGPILLSIVLSAIIFLWNKKIDKSLPPSFLSRLLGSLFNLSWGSCVVMSILLTISIIPFSIPALQSIQHNIVDSSSYSLVERFIKNKIPFLNNTEAMINASKDPKLIEKIQSTPEFATLYRDDRIQEILADKETVSQIERKDALKLLSNPKILAVWQNGELIKKISDLGGVIIKRESQKNPAALQVPEVN